MSDSIFELEDRVALVTGAGQNVGRGIAQALAARGAQVLVNDIVAERAKGVADAIEAEGDHASALPFDVTNLDDVLEALGSVGPVDILVNNAGNGGHQPMSLRPFVEMEPSMWEGPIRVNLYGVLHCCHAVVPGMCERGWGRVITISSGAATAGVNIGVSPYSAGKGGGIAFTRTLALEIARSGVTANTLAIGLMDLPDPRATDALARRIPVGRTGTPDDIAAACTWLVSEEASWVTGQTIQLNGGSITT